jgi:hypothetical protein
MQLRCPRQSSKYFHSTLLYRIYTNDRYKISSVNASLGQSVSYHTLPEEKPNIMRDFAIFMTNLNVSLHLTSPVLHRQINASPATDEHKIFGC